MSMCNVTGVTHSKLTENHRRYLRRSVLVSFSTLFWFYCPLYWFGSLSLLSSTSLPDIDSNCFQQKAKEKKFYTLPAQHPTSDRKS